MVSLVIILLHSYQLQCFFFVCFFFLGGGVGIHLILCASVKFLRQTHLPEHSRDLKICTKKWTLPFKVIFYHPLRNKIDQFSREIILQPFEFIRIDLYKGQKKVKLFHF